MSVTKGLLVRVEALPGKEDEVQEFLNVGRGLVEEEPATTAWFAIRLGPSSFGIFDVFWGVTLLVDGRYQEGTTGRDVYESQEVH